MSFAAVVLQPRARCASHASEHRKGSSQGSVQRLRVLALEVTCDGDACLQQKYMLLQRVWFCDTRQDILRLWSAATAGDRLPVDFQCSHVRGSTANKTGTDCCWCQGTSPALTCVEGTQITVVFLHQFTDTQLVTCNRNSCSFHVAACGLQFWAWCLAVQSSHSKWTIVETIHASVLACRLDSSGSEQFLFAQLRTPLGDCQRPATVCYRVCCGCCGRLCSQLFWHHQAVPRGLR